MFICTVCNELVFIIDFEMHCLVYKQINFYMDMIVHWNLKMLMFYENMIFLFLYVLSMDSVCRVKGLFLNAVLEKISVMNFNWHQWMSHFKGNNS